jgi:hypothetical protein
VALLTLSRVYLADAGRVALLRGTPLLVGVAIAASILFGPQGMTAADAVGALERTPLLGLGLFAAWILAAGPSVRPLFGTRTTLILRSLAPPRAFYPAILVALAVAEAPWVILFLKGAGPVAGLAALATTMAVHASLAGRRPLVAALVVAAVIVAAPTARALAGGLALLVGLPAAFRAAAEPRAGHRGWRFGARPTVALAAAHLAGALRGAPAAWIRALIVTAAAGLLVALVGRNHALSGRPLVSLALAMGAPALVVALGGVISALAAAEAAAAWVVDAAGVPRETRTAARVLAAAAAGAVAGALLGAVVAPLAGVAAAPWGALLATLLAAGERRAAGNSELAFMLALAVAVGGALVAGLLL